VPTKTTEKKGQVNNLDPIAKLVATRYREAKMWRGTDMIGGSSVDTVLARAYNQYHSIHDACDAELVADSGVDAYPSITHQKVNTLTAFMRDLVFSNNDKFITAIPTPIPDLSESGKLQALEAAKATLRGQQPTDQAGLEEMLRHVKDQTMHEEMTIALKHSTHQEKVMNDVLVETRFRHELMAHLHHVALDPYAVMVGSIKRGETVLQYSGNRLVEKNKSNYYFHNVDPRDYYYSSDARGHGTGAYEITVETMSRGKLYDIRNSKGWIQSNVEKCIEDFSTNKHYDWLQMGDSRESTSIIPWGTTDSIKVLRHFGVISGKELRPFGFSLDDDKFYETMALVCGEYTLKIEVNVDMTAQRRRIYTTSFQRSPDRIAGFGLAQLLRDIERMYLAAVRATVSNMGYASAPMGEVDLARVQRHMAKEEIGSVFPGTMMPVDPDITGGSRQAYNFYNLPNNTASFANLINYFMELADRHSGLPAMLHGQPIGTGANRTFRGMMALYSNAMKGVQSAFMNIDDDILSPLGQNLHYVLHKEHNFKGDSSVQVLGLAGLLKQQIKQQTAMENLQLISQIAASAPDSLPGTTMEWTIGEVLRTSGVPDSVIDAPKAQPVPSTIPEG